MSRLPGWRPGNFLRHVAVLAGASAIAQLISVLAAPLLTRLYRPEDFGILAIFASILSTAIVCSALRYEMAIPLPESDRSASALAALSATLVLVIAGMLLIPVLLASRPIAAAFHAPGLAGFLWLLPLGVAGGGLYQVGSSWAIRTRSYKPIAQTTVTKNAAMATTQIAMSAVSSGALGLITGDLVGRIVGAGRLVRSAFQSGRLRRTGLSINAQRRIARQYKHYPMLSLPAALLNNVGLQLPVLVLAYTTDPRTVGLFALTHRLLSIPLTMVGRAVGQVFFGEASARGDDSASRIAVLFRMITSRLLIMALFPAAILALGGPWLFSSVFGPVWKEAGVYARLLSPVLVAQFVLAPVAQVLNLTNHLERQLGWDLARLVVVSGAMLIGARVGGARGAIIAYSVSLCVLYVILFVLYSHALRQHLRASKSTARQWLVG